MKNSIKWIRIVALIAVIGFSFAACGDPEQGTTGLEEGDYVMLPYIPANSGLLGTTWKAGEYSITFNDDGGYGYTISWISNIFQISDIFQITSYGKRPDGSHIILFLRDNTITVSSWTVKGNTLTSGDNTYTKEE